MTTCHNFANLLIIGRLRRDICIYNSNRLSMTNMTKYNIKYKECDREWSSTSYSTPEKVTTKSLITFFGLEECEDYDIEVETL